MAKQHESSHQAEITVDHEEIRRWVQERGGCPATVKSTVKPGEAAGLLRIDFPGFSGEKSLEQISWEDFFEKFDKEKLAFIYSEEPGNRFSKFIARPAEVK